MTRVSRTLIIRNPLLLDIDIIGIGFNHNSIMDMVEAKIIVNLLNQF